MRTINLARKPGPPKAFKTESFWEYVIKDASGCWLWLGVSGRGRRDRHPRVRLESGEYDYAHRVAYRLANQIQIPKGLVVRHACDVPACVNPAHLSLGTQAQNVADRDQRGRTGTVGERNRHAKLTADTVRCIRALRATHGLSQPRLAALFHISVTGINSIVLRKTWRHV